MTSASDSVRRRPKDRKDQIARASADAFGSLGYHAVSMEDIAARVGITPAALYRHSPSKYDLFRDAVLALGQTLVDATETVPDDPSDPAATLEALAAALIEATLANRTAGGLYRWEARYLQGADRAALVEQVRVVNHRLEQPLSRLRPRLNHRQRSALTVAALSVIGSITDHVNPLAANDIRSCMAMLVSGVLAADIPATRRRSESGAVVVGASAGMYEHVLYEAVRLFYEHGYRNTSMEDIASAVGIQASGLYRSFPGKADILGLAYRRAADRHSGDVAEVLSRVDDPEEALVGLIDAFLARLVESPGLAYVYYTERHNVPESDLRVLEALEHSAMESWARLVVAVRPEVKIGWARYAVCAAFALTVDFGRLFEGASVSIATVRRLMEVTLLGRPAHRR
ncbi:TetR/AcrR family transcriptional regulator [Mycobacterium sp. M26]|uniref:TetR/AcrR family transcriptional regulator n=1 Tax=Mycobacterium sp. M26 TaxID=1762962 RepID=UPI00073E4BD8|nr:TetR/AcrR family transcriptional regulator [Mycobacterium sp. M26]